MPKPRTVEAKLAHLRELRGRSASPELLHEVRAGLRDASNIVVAEAAEIAGAARLTELAPDLVNVFQRFLDDDPVKKDKQCRAKIAAVEALNKLEYAEEGFYWSHARYVQSEPVWGGSQDTAVPVRVACAFGLVRLRHREVMLYLVDLLTDPEKGARAGAAQALSSVGTEAAGLLLRLKARLGDAEPEVIAECLDGVLELSRGQGIAFVTGFLGSNDEPIQEAALLALGSSRLPEAFPVLKSFAEAQTSRIRDVAFMAMALLRLPAATDHLLTLVAAPSRAVAAAAIEALAVQRYDPRVRERVAAAVAQRDNTVLQELFEKKFRGSE